MLNKVVGIDLAKNYFQVCVEYLWVDFIESKSKPMISN